MIEQFITHKGKKYQVSEPTIQIWADVMKLKDVLDPQELNYRMIEKMTGMDGTILREAKASDVNKVANSLIQYLNVENRQFFKQFEFEGKTYRFVDVNKMTFGQFVDIDTFLQKDEIYRLSNLHELASYLYIEIQNDKHIPYSDIDFQQQSEAFKRLPIKYLEGAIFFFLILGRGLQGLIQTYSNQPTKWAIMMTGAIFQSIGDGIVQLANSRKTKFGKLIVWSISPLLVVSIISLTLLTLLMKKIKSLRK